MRISRAFTKTFEGYKVIPYPPRKGEVLPDKECIYHLRIRKGREDPHSYEPGFTKSFKKKVEFQTVRGISMDFHHVHALRIFSEWYKDGQFPHLDYVLMYNFMKDPLSLSYKPEWGQFYDMGVFTEVLELFPKLKGYHQKGGYITGFSGKIRHSHLKTLIFETRGVNDEFLNRIFDAKFSKLRRLDIHIGRDRKKDVTDISLFDPLLSGKCFPKLTHLKLGGSVIADKLAYELAKSPLLENLKVVDLSGGRLHDQGAEILMNNLKNKKKLKVVNFSHNVLSKQYCSSLKELSESSVFKIKCSSQSSDQSRDYKDRSEDHDIDMFLMKHGLWWVS